MSIIGYVPDRPLPVAQAAPGSPPALPYALVHCEAMIPSRLKGSAPAPPALRMFTLRSMLRQEHIAVEELRPTRHDSPRPPALSYP